MNDFWENTYRDGHRQTYPWDIVVSFVFRHAPSGIPRPDVNILEVGFGTGANLWFAAREGFSVSGIEASETAVEVARERFSDEGLHGDLRHGSFTDLPFDDDSFDLVIDRAALTCSPLQDISVAVGEISRVSKPGARFFFNPYATGEDSEQNGSSSSDGPRTDIVVGNESRLDNFTFLSAEEVRSLISDHWEIESLRRVELVELVDPEATFHAEWRVVAKREQDD